MHYTCAAIITSWKWRIVKAGHTVNSFANEYGLSQSKISEYCSGKRTPRIDTFDRIEGALRSLGV